MNRKSKPAEKRAKKTINRVHPVKSRGAGIRQGGLFNRVKKVVKRSGQVVSLDQKKITVAVAKAFVATGEGNLKDAQKVSEKVIRLLNKNYKKGG